MDIRQRARQLGASKALIITKEQLVIEQAVRNACVENQCGHYDSNFMCPPHVGEISDFEEVLDEYSQGLLVQVKRDIKSLEDKEAILSLAGQLHQLVLAIEKEAKQQDYSRAKALSAGHCKLCEPCPINTGADTCIKPDLARPAMEAVGINVVESCRRAGAPLEFLQHEVTWVGLILLK
ncbi:DUF2284 domain-containing protein [Metallumcola ferriviriculae]|uniref:DUF2284 domain-containing protein n=1 Tax=Metallumcola ferriviriculae TaxID=3039180 RepID=A0AAU0UMT5_9FIRM|nr:DUF2284 domain-containing protein [Desulfitibacteraceae bacterium MK1]